jgi:hypothetical protein
MGSSALIPGAVRFSNAMVSLARSWVVETAPPVGARPFMTIGAAGRPDPVKPRLTSGVVWMAVSVVRSGAKMRVCMRFG